MLKALVIQSTNSIREENILQVSSIALQTDFASNQRVIRKKRYEISSEDLEKIEHHLDLGGKNEFPKKAFVIEGKEKLYSSYLFFTESKLNIENKGSKIEYKCLLCPVVITCIPSDSRNIKRHLEYNCKNKFLIERWMKDYNKSQNVKKKIISNEILNLVLFFISTNYSLIQLENPFLRKFFSIELPCARTFKETILPDVLNKLHECLEKKLNLSSHVSIITDIWTDRQMHDFMGLAAAITNSVFEREIIVIGMISMPGNHCAENIQEAIENIINRFDFNYSKISGIY